MPRTSDQVLGPELSGLDAKLTLAHAASLAGISRVALQRAVQRGTLAHSTEQVGRGMVHYTTPRAVQAYLERRTSAVSDVSMVGGVACGHGHSERSAPRTRRGA